MKMNVRMIAGLLALTSSAFANVNLDQPVAVGLSDKAFKSAADPNVVYYFPIALNRNGPVTSSKLDDDWLNYRFSAGVDQVELRSVESEVKEKLSSPVQVRIFRPVSYSISPGTDIPRRFDGRLTPLGDLDLAGPMQYSLQLRRFSHWFGPDEGEELASRLFNSRDQDNVALITYQFDAVAAGKPYLAKTAVAIFAGVHPEMTIGSKLVSLVTGKIDWDEISREVNRAIEPVSDGIQGRTAPEESSPPVILKDRIDHCWNQVRPGEFCLREK